MSKKCIDAKKSMGGNYFVQKNVPSLTSTERKKRLPGSPGSVDEPYSATSNLLIDSILPI